MSPRLRASITVSFVIALLTLFFLLTLVRQQQQALADVVRTEQRSQNLQIRLLQEQIGRSYRARLKSFVANRKQVVNAFAAGDRDSLLQSALPIMQLLKKENPYFKTLFFANPDSRTFLRVHKPDLFGDDLTQLSPLVPEGNRTKKMVAGFEVVKKGLQYRIVAPVYVAGKYAGLVGFGIDADYFLSQMGQVGHEHAHLDIHAKSDLAVFLPLTELGKISFLKKQHVTVGDYAVFDYGETHFKEFFKQTNLNPENLQGGQQVELHGVQHALIQGAGFKNFRGEQIAGILSLIDIGELVSGTRQTIVQTVTIALVLLVVAIVSLHFSFGVLFNRINLLTESLENANRDLERRVQDRTSALQQSNQQLETEIKERQQVEEVLRQSQKMEAVGQLAGGVAHDFNNMLGGIMGAAELLSRRLPDDPKQRKFLGMITESAERAAGLTANLLSFARKQPISSTPIDAQQALRNALSLLENTLDRRIKLVTDLTSTAGVVVGDQSQLQNVFLNLGINASQSMPDGGALSVVSQIVTLGKAECDLSSFDLYPGEYLEIVFRDTGCGISPDNLEHIFEPFFTTKERGKGTGLGLASVFGTLQQHGGAISVQSELGTGTVFKVLLPLVASEAQPQTSTETAVSGQGLVLIVDDEAVMRATAGSILEELGYQILTADDGRSGLELFKQRSAEIDLVLLDMIMPEMGGRDCFSALQKIDPDVRVLLSSGFTRGKDLLDLRAAGLLGFIRKPYRAVALSQAVAAALNDDPNEQSLWG